VRAALPEEESVGIVWAEGDFEEVLDRGVTSFAKATAVKNPPAPTSRRLATGEGVRGVGKTLVFGGRLPERLEEGLSGERWLLLNPEARLPEGWDAAVGNREVTVILGSAGRVAAQAVLGRRVDGRRARANRTDARSGIVSGRVGGVSMG